MKKTLPCPPALTVALLCAGGWTVFWLAAFRPARPPSIPLPEPPSLIQLPPGNEPLRELLNPALFALPHRKGFSSEFPARTATIRLSLEKPVDPFLYLRRDDLPPEIRGPSNAGESL